MNKIIERMTRLCPLSDIFNDPDIFYNIIKDIDNMSKKLKIPEYHQPVYKVYPDFSQRIIISPRDSNSSEWMVSVFVALHENDTELPVNICLCVPPDKNIDDVIDSPELKMFVDIYVTQVVRLFIDKGYSLMDIFNITGRNFNMDRKTVLKFYNSTVEKYFPERKHIGGTNMNICGTGIQIVATERGPIPPYFKSSNDDAEWEWDPNLHTYRKLKDILEEERIGGNNNE